MKLTAVHIALIGGGGKVGAVFSRGNDRLVTVGGIK